ncbi:MAG: flavin reductase family protein [Planctomycetota bacterium]|jgi:flavin reductase (DIM6/NTAB) family NADH-FMN oxidoreductase RutF|nr:flavin reductase family protein [Planctomycetota bacterium]
MEIDPATESSRDFYFRMVSLITPRPIAWVSTISDDGISNLAPYSFFNGISSSPPSVVFSPVNRPDGTKKDTVLNIEQNGEFVINTVSRGIAEKMNLTAGDYGYAEDEFDIAGLTQLESRTVQPFRVAESSANFECELIQIVNVGEGPLAANLVIGKIKHLHIQDEVLDDRGRVDPQKLDNVGRLGGSAYSTTRDRFHIERPGVK